MVVLVYFDDPQFTEEMHLVQSPFNPSVRLPIAKKLPLLPCPSFSQSSSPMTGVEFRLTTSSTIVHTNYISLGHHSSKEGEACRG